MNTVILTQKEVDEGKAPAHTSCIPWNDNGVKKYIFSGKTGSGKPTKAKSTGEPKKPQKKPPKKPPKKKSNK